MKISEEIFPNISVPLLEQCGIVSTITVSISMSNQILLSFILNRVKGPTSCILAMIKTTKNISIQSIIQNLKRWNSAFISHNGILKYN